MKTQQEQLFEASLQTLYPVIVEQLRERLSLVANNRCSLVAAVTRLKADLANLIEELGLEASDIAALHLMRWVGDEFCKVVFLDIPVFPRNVTWIRDLYIPHANGGDPFDRLVYGTLSVIRLCRHKESPYHKAAVELSQYIEDTGLREHFVDIE